MALRLTDPWPGIDPGRFNKKITLLEQVTAADASGSVVTYTADSPPVVAWVQIEWMRGDDMIKAGQDVSQVYGKITGWWRSSFTANKRIQTISGNQYVIQAVENVREMNTFMVMMVQGLGLNN